MKPQYPEYDHSLLSLISSILTHYGVQTPHKTLPELDSLLAKSYKNIVVMLFDGMGTAILENHLPPDAFLRRHLNTTLSSVFPPTTTAATVSLESGLSPIEHAWLGWSLYFEELDANVNLFPNTLSGTDGKPAADFSIARKTLPYTSVFTKIDQAGLAKAYRISPYSSFQSKSISEICDTVQKLCAQEGRQYLYTYWPQPDYDMHDHGTQHPKITGVLSEINTLTERMCRQLSDTLVIITADHGLVDTTWRFLSDYPELTACFARAPSIETRAMTFFIKPDRKAQFEKLFRASFGDCFQLFTKEDVLLSNLFGNGTPHIRAKDFIGDYLAVATGTVSIDPGERTDEVFKAAHAGLTDEELNVPFITVECK